MTCSRTLFEPTLSYAQLSEFNIDQVVLVDTTRRQTATGKFQVAMDTQQRVVKAIRDADVKLMTDFLTLSEEYMTLLANIVNESSSSADLALKYHFPDIFDPLDSAISDDVEYARNRAEEIDDAKGAAEIGFWPTRKQLWRIRTILLGYDDNGDFGALNTIRDCIANGLTGNEDVQTSCPGNTCSDDVKHYCFLSSLRTIPITPGDVYADGGYMHAEEIVRGNLGRLDDYVDLVEWTYAGQPVAPETLALAHNACVAKLDFYQNQVWPPFQLAMKLIKNLTLVNNLQEAQAIFVAIDDLVNTALAPYLFVPDPVIGWTPPPAPSGASSAGKDYDSAELNCDWYLAVEGGEIDPFKDSVGSLMTNIQTVRALATAERDAMLKKLRFLLELAQAEMMAPLTAARAYLNGAITKAAFSELATSAELSRAVAELSATKAELVATAGDFKDAYQGLTSLIKVCYKTIFTMTFPFLTESNKDEYAFLQKMMEWYENLGGKEVMDEYLALDGDIDYVITPETEINEFNIWMVIGDAVEGFQTKGMSTESGLDAFTRKITKGIIGQITQLTTQYDTLISAMATYARSTKMDTNFYMQVDSFNFHLGLKKLNASKAKNQKKLEAITLADQRRMFRASPGRLN